MRPHVGGEGGPWRCLLSAFPLPSQGASFSPEFLGRTPLRYGLNSEDLHTWDRLGLPHPGREGAAGHSGRTTRGGTLSPIRHLSGGALLWAGSQGLEAPLRLRPAASWSVLCWSPQGPRGGWGSGFSRFPSRKAGCPGGEGFSLQRLQLAGNPPSTLWPGALLSRPLLPLSLTSPPFYFSSYLYFLFFLPLLGTVWFDLSFSFIPTLSFCPVPIFLHCLSSDAVTSPSPVSYQLSSLSHLCICL